MHFWQLLDAMNQDSGIPLTSLKVDGGMTANSLLMQIQADLLGIPVGKVVSFIYWLSVLAKSYNLWDAMLLIPVNLREWVDILSITYFT